MKAKHVTHNVEKVESSRVLFPDFVLQVNVVDSFHLLHCEAALANFKIACLVKELVAKSTFNDRHYFLPYEGGRELFGQRFFHEALHARHKSLFEELVGDFFAKGEIFLNFGHCSSDILRNLMPLLMHKLMHMNFFATSELLIIIIFIIVG